FKGADREQALENASRQIQKDVNGGEIREYQEGGEMKITKPWVPRAKGTVRPVDAYANKRINAILTGHGDGCGHLRKEGRYDMLEEEFLGYLGRHKGALGRIVIGVCYSQDPATEPANGPNLCRKASCAAGGLPTWGHEGLGYLDENGTPLSDEPGTQGQPQPGPFRYEESGSRAPSSFPSGRPQ
ncbi:MAG: hypothetical protein ACK58T_50555, partial [Phycisphaerae bacterium]